MLFRSGNSENVLRISFAVLKGKFEILSSFDEPVHVLKEFFRTDTGVHLSGGNIGMPQHPTDGLNRHTSFERNQRGETMAGLMVAQVILDACQCRQRFHVPSKIGPAE